MKVVLADIREEALEETTRLLEASGAMVLAVPTDVSRREDVQALADRTLDAYGAVHLLFNNAGVVGGSTIWDSTLAAWEWVMGVNLWGVIHGLQVFVPIMLEQGTECHIVNTASVAGLVPYRQTAPYHVSKHAVVALSEQLYHSLAAANARIGASVLCPAWVRTEILRSGRNRPPEPQQEPRARADPFREADGRTTREAIETGMPPEQVADKVFRGIREERLYILTHRDFDADIRKRTEEILRPWD